MAIIASPRKIAANYLGPQSDPEEIRNLRQSSLDFHLGMGTFVVFKHKWNEKDVQEGRAKHCPLHDQILDQDAYDPYCFGTGYLGGFEDGTVVPVTLGDAQEDVFRPNERGFLIHERHPGLTAPWTPEMGDGDLIITAELDPLSYNITELGDRYELREVQPVTMRGPSLANGNTFHLKPYRVNQEAMVDLLPYGHQFYNVPVNFDYSNVPILHNTTTFETSIRFKGQEQKSRSSYSQAIRVAATGLSSSYSQTIRLRGTPVGTHVHL